MLERLLLSQKAVPPGAEQAGGPSFRVLRERVGLRRSDKPPKNFHRPVVTSNLVRRFQIGDHGRGRDGWYKPARRTP